MTQTILSFVLLFVNKPFAQLYSNPSYIIYFGWTYRKCVRWLCPWKVSHLMHLTRHMRQCGGKWCTNLMKTKLKSKSSPRPSLIRRSRNFEVPKVNLTKASNRPLLLVEIHKSITSRSSNLKTWPPMLMLVPNSSQMSLAIPILWVLKLLLVSNQLNIVAYMDV